MTTLRKWAISALACAAYVADLLVFLVALACVALVVLILEPFKWMAQRRRTGQNESEQHKRQNQFRSTD